MKPCGFRVTTSTQDVFGCLNTKQIDHLGTVPASLCSVCPYARTLTYEDQSKLLSNYSYNQAKNQKSCSNCSEGITNHLTYHIWPVKYSNTWKFNIEYLSKYTSIFNGTIVVGVALDDHTVPIEEVKTYFSRCGIRVDKYLTFINNPELREVVTWLPMLETLNVHMMDNTHYVFSAHAKGVRHEGIQSHIRLWAECMYDSNLSDIGHVHQLLTTYSAVGAFRREGLFGATNEPSNWHYSGTFFWWKPSDVCKSSSWKLPELNFYGTETWIGKQIDVTKSACTFLDNCGHLYAADYWSSVVLPQWNSQYPEYRKTLA